MTKINIFKNKEKSIDLPKFIDSRALVCANSGGGKSYAIRKLLEETHGKVMSIVLDVEGEFKTLREEYDFLLIGQAGDVPLSMNAAHLLPEKLLELNISTIIDISELKKHERVLYVKKFLEAMMELPRKFWKPCIVVVDEAHNLCGQQDKHESGPAVIDLMSRGRKRGFEGVLATQRIAKLHKDACAECNNVMIGRTGLDVDMKRAAELLGFTSKEQMLSLRDLEEGEFYVFGPAISRHVEKEKVAEVKTTHPKVGMDIRAKIIPPTEKVKNILSNLKGLPEDAKKDKIDKEDMRKEILRLKNEVRNNKPVIDNNALKISFDKGYKKAQNEHEIKLEGISKLIKSSSNIILNEIEKKEYSHTSKVEYSIPKPIIQKEPVSKEVSLSPEDKMLCFGKCEKAIYSFLNAYPDRAFSKSQIGAVTGYSPSSGSFSNAISKLSSVRYITRIGNELQVNPQWLGSEIVADLISDFDFSIKNISNILGKCEKEIYNILLENPGEEFTKESLAEITPSKYSASSGSYSNALSRLSTLGLLIKSNGMIKLNPELNEV